jgi:hypothetical protein
MTKISIRRRLEAFFHSKTGKILPVLLIALLIGAASSTVYSYYIMSNTATVRTPDVRLVAGTDSSSCTTYPCTTVSVSSTYDYATVSFSLFPSVTNSPQPATYYSNLTTIQNKGTLAHSIDSIQISGISETGTPAPLGTITVYYCSAHTEFNPNGTPVTACVGSYAITSTTSGTISGISSASPASLPAGAPNKGYIEVAAYAASGATAGTISFQISIQWV